MGPSRLDTSRVTEAAEEQALVWLRRHDEREDSWVDATSFAMMHRRRIERAFTFDGDLSAAGFIELHA